jgi:hypothetical protein
MGARFCYLCMRWHTQGWVSVCVYLIGRRGCLPVKPCLNWIHHKRPSDGAKDGERGRLKTEEEARETERGFLAMPGQRLQMILYCAGLHICSAAPW